MLDQLLALLELLVADGALRSVLMEHMDAVRDTALVRVLTAFDWTTALKLSKDSLVLFGVVVLGVVCFVFCVVEVDVAVTTRVQFACVRVDHKQVVVTCLLVVECLWTLAAYPRVADVVDRLQMGGLFGLSVVVLWTFGAGIKVRVEVPVVVPHDVELQQEQPVG